MLTDARSHSFDVVVAEALDRLTRDQEHVAALYKQLSFANVRIVTLAEGEISELHVGLKVTMNALFLKDLGAKTHRGLRGRIEAGRSAGGICYGYRTVREHDARGELIRGGRSIDATEAAIVRRIFEEFAIVSLTTSNSERPQRRGHSGSASLRLGAIDHLWQLAPRNGNPEQ
jgi:DNA invertase Pin-like site-specific DNA recombinase